MFIPPWYNFAQTINKQKSKQLYNLWNFHWTVNDGIKLFRFKWIKCLINESLKTFLITLFVQNIILKYMVLIISKWFYTRSQIIIVKYF